MLDQMSGGRFQFGVGKGISPIETRYYGVDPDKSTRMMIEAFEVLMRGLQNRTLDFAGEFYNFKNVPARTRARCRNRTRRSGMAPARRRAWSGRRARA